MTAGSRLSHMLYIVYWSDVLGGWAFEHHSRTGGAEHLPIKTACRAGHLTIFFKCPGFAWGIAWVGGCSQLE